MSWSSQRYIAQGLAHHRDPELLKRAAKEIEKSVYRTPRVPAVLTLAHLAKRSGVDYRRVRDLTARSDPYSYSYFRIRKRSGGHRLISVPSPDLLKVQSWIHHYILTSIKPHPACYSFLPKVSIRDCAAVHVGSRWIIKVDISAFFGSISERDVFDVFRSFGHSPLVSFEMARLTTDAPIFSKRFNKIPWKRPAGRYKIGDYSSTRVGFLPQGAPSSPLLSNFVMREIDTKLAATAEQLALRYTRYSDDLTFSTTGNFDRDRAKQLIHTVERVISIKGLRLNGSKTRIIPPGGRRVVLGLLVDGSEPCLTKKFRDNIRMHLHYMKTYGVATHAQRRGFDSISGLHRHLKGLVDYARSINEQYAAEALSAFNALDWPNASAGE